MIATAIGLPSMVTRPPTTAASWKTSLKAGDNGAGSPAVWHDPGFAFVHLRPTGSSQQRYIPGASATAMASISWNQILDMAAKRFTDWYSHICWEPGMLWGGQNARLNASRVMRTKVPPVSAPVSVARVWGGKKCAIEAMSRGIGIDYIFERNVHCLLGLPFDAVDMGGAVSRIRDAATRRQSCFFSTPNLNFVVACLTDDHFRDSVIESDLSIADGMPLVWVARLLDIPIRERIADPACSKAAWGQPMPTFRLFVWRHGRRCRSRLQPAELEFGGLICVGYDSGGFGSVEELSSDDTVARINVSGADFVVVSLGARKGQASIVHIVIGLQRR